MRCHALWSNHAGKGFLVTWRGWNAIDHPQSKRVCVCFFFRKFDVTRVGLAWQMVGIRQCGRQKKGPQEWWPWCSHIVVTSERQDVHPTVVLRRQVWCLKEARLCRVSWVGYPAWFAVLLKAKIGNFAGFVNSTEMWLFWGALSRHINFEGQANQ